MVIPNNLNQFERSNNSQIALSSLVPHALLKVLTVHCTALVPPQVSPSALKSLTKTVDILADSSDDPASDTDHSAEDH